ncbi:MAG TPA: amino-acid N-acetyltransferase [Gammaproteobacteria bacterium]|nr:amino-acid N-acetyltransferase [Gammaproteobacteria bacterium]
MSAKKDINRHIQWFRNAAPYINAHRGRTFVLLFGGEIAADERFADLIHDCALLQSLGIKLVLVHGARPQIDAALQQRGIKTPFVRDLRVTDGSALPVVQETVGRMRIEIEARLSMGLASTPMSGSQIRATSGNFVVAKPVGVHDGVDFCHTGDIRKVDHAAVRTLLDAGHIVLLSPLGYSPTGEVFNLRAEDVATATAAALKADKLILMVAGAGLVEGKKPVRQLTLGQAESLLNSDGLLPEPLRRNLQSAISACRQGVSRVHLIGHDLDGGLLQELYTRDGSGTLVTGGKYEDLRNALIDDVGGILELIKPLEENGTLVRRSREQLELEIDRFLLIERDGMIIGCSALYPYPEEKMGELACIAVHPDYGDNGRGSELLEAMQQRARQLGLKRLFVLTTQTTHWFRERGFTEGDLETLPVKKRELYNYQRNSKVLFKPL